MELNRVLNGLNITDNCVDIPLRVLQFLEHRYLHIWDLGIYYLNMDQIYIAVDCRVCNVRSLQINYYRNKERRHLFVHHNYLWK